MSVNIKQFNQQYTIKSQMDTIINDKPMIISTESILTNNMNQLKCQHTQVAIIKQMNNDWVNIKPNEHYNIQIVHRKTNQVIFTAYTHAKDFILEYIQSRFQITL